jgi:hypothetical protein
MNKIYSQKLGKEIWKVKDEYAKRELLRKGTAKGLAVYTENEVKILSRPLSDATRKKINLIKEMFDTSSVDKI